VLSRCGSDEERGRGDNDVGADELNAGQPVAAAVERDQCINLKDAVKDNEFYRKVLFTGQNSQLVVMTLAPGEEIGFETHAVDQFIYVVKGEGRSVIGKDTAEFEEGNAICIPAGEFHNVVNTDDKPMKLFTIYSPPQHPANLTQETKPAEATATA
jgi:mannose-6-phosphate isomerase-like protein (cupin superfamily)